MAHHLIALLFSSAWYTTSPCLKPTRPVACQRFSFLISSISYTAFISSFRLSLSAHFSVSPFFFMQPGCPSLFAPFPLLFYACLCVSLSVCVSLPLLKSPFTALPISPIPAVAVFSADVPLVNGGLAGRKQK